jgi:ABC-type phosphate transport system substrate-binding protein
MKLFFSSALAFAIFLFSTSLVAQPAKHKKVVITGVRFTYPLIEQWISDYQKSNPGAEVVIEARSATDPADYDVLIEAYEPEKEVKENREYLYVGRYALLPIANANSSFAKRFIQKGVTQELIKQVYFHDIYSDKEKREEINIPFTVYTRLQKAGAPLTFAKYFGYEQQNINGKAIAGGDEHLIKALLKDSTGVSYSHAGLIYDLETRQVKQGISVLPVDADNNGRVSQNERFYESLDVVLQKLQSEKAENIPVGEIHLSLRKNGYSPEALNFLRWVSAHGTEHLHHFGFLQPDQKRLESEKQKFEQLALRY